MRVFQVTATLLAALLCGHQLHAQQITGNELHQWLSEAEPPQAGIASVNQQANIARGYVLGVTETLVSSKIICIPHDVSRDQILDIIPTMIYTHPQLGRMNANRLVAAALQDVFPCKP